MSYSAEVLADSPLIYLRLGDASGTTAADSSGNSRPGSYTASPTLGATGLLTGDSDKAVTFNGTTQFASVAVASWMDVAAFSYEFWFKTTQTGTVRVLATRHSGVNAAVFQVTITAGAVAYTLFKNFTGTTVATSAATFNDGIRHHVVVTYASGVGKLYIDNTLIGSASSLDPTTTATTAGITLAAREGPAFLCACTLDEFAMYAAELSSTRIGAHYTAGTTAGPASGTATGSLGGVAGSASGTRTEPGTAAGSLGGVAGAASGVRKDIGSATGSLGGISGSAVPGGAVAGTATGGLGGIAGAATGVRFDLGTATGTLGALTGNASGIRVDVGSATGTLGSIDGAATGTASGTPVVITQPFFDFIDYDVLAGSVTTPVVLGADHIQWGFLVFEGECQGGDAP